MQEKGLQILTQNSSINWPLVKSAVWSDRLNSTFTQTPWWGWAMCLAFLLGGLLVGLMTKSLLRRTSKKWEAKNRIIRSAILTDLAGPLSLAFLAIGATVGIEFIHLEGRALTFAWKMCMFMYLVGFCWFVFNLVDVIEILMTRRFDHTSDLVDNSLVTLVRKALRVFLVGVFFLFIAQNIFGLNITGWLAGFGIAGLAISMAAQDSVKNLFGSLMIHFDKPFAVGDWVIFEGNEGYVEEIGFRSTRIRIWPRYQVTVPNMKFNDGIVTNVQRRPLDRRVMDIFLTYDTSPEKMQKAVDIVKEILYSPEIAAYFDLTDYPPHVGFNEFNAWSLNLRIYYYFIQHINDRNYWSYFDHAHKVNMLILQRFKEAEIDFAFPTQTLHLAGDPKQGRHSFADGK